MLVFDALVRGRVTYEVADGPPIRVPQGHCRVQAHEGFVSLSWSEDKWTNSATLTAERFWEYLDSGAILVLDAAQLGRARAPARP